MTVIIQIHYTSIANTKGYQKAAITLKGRSKEQAAYEFWKWIKRKNPLKVEIKQVLCEKEDITELVLELEKQEIDKIMNDNLPF
ncbi:hypothetical protein QNH20_18280 [Neobacillus sp. WH10]|uniref:hypothetical protein n=1 Tax=Neobacillus sp. WH10 TaxID=3047873 RepID=UPI0024C17F3C|nr:hypothetical protein [Neobacillus sp. WH10]WHY76060.1 hypothetical protein QNH20_18280 [Neobacillus sp. WH10]